MAIRRLEIASYVATAKRKRGNDSAVNGIRRQDLDNPQIVVNARSVDDIAKDAADMLGKQLERQRARWGFI